MEKNKEKYVQKKTDRILSSCKLCFANGFIHNDQILKMGDHCALIIPNKRKYINRIFYLFTYIKKKIRTLQRKLFPYNHLRTFFFLIRS